MINSPVLSVITPVFNGEKYLTETIESVLNANIGCHYEYLIIDDGSTDSSLEIMKGYDNQASIYSQSNIGEAGTVNRGLHYAQGSYVLVLSADDPMLSGELVEKAIELLSLDEHIVAVYPDWNVIDEKGKFLRTNHLPDYSDVEMIGKSKCLPGPGVIFRRSKALEIGGRNPNWKYVSDFDFWLRLSRTGKILHLPEVLAQWRANENSISISQRNIKMAQERIDLIEEFLSKNNFSRDLEKMARGNAYYLAARLSYFDSSINGRELIIDALKYRRGIPEECGFLQLIFLLLWPVSLKITKKIPERLIRKFL
jgi:glycosyltransferase involved in cell wall biosynthesis